MYPNKVTGNFPWVKSAAPCIRSDRSSAKSGRRLPPLRARQSARPAIRRPGSRFHAILRVEFSRAIVLIGHPYSLDQPLPAQPAIPTKPLWDERADQGVGSDERHVFVTFLEQRTMLRDACTCTAPGFDRDVGPPAEITASRPHSMRPESYLRTPLRLASDACRHSQVTRNDSIIPRGAIHCAIPERLAPSSCRTLPDRLLFRPRHLAHRRLTGGNRWTP